MNKPAKPWVSKKNHLHLHCGKCAGRAPIMYASIIRNGVRIYFCSRICAYASGAGVEIMDRKKK